MNNEQLPLCVDLDGTLIKTDLLWESLVQFVVRSPAKTLLLPVWLIRGKAYFKSRIASGTELDIDTVPLNPEVVEYIRAQKSNGRRIVLVTASVKKYAEKIAEQVGLFDSVLCSSDSVNLSGAAKRDRLVAEFGESGFDYIGNSTLDRIVWRSAKKPLIANARPALAAAVTRKAPDALVLSTRQTSLTAMLHALRPHQWVKNALVFVPLFVSHTVTNAQNILACVLAFAAFTLCAASVYLINDIVDIQSDRRHPTKRNRPIAAAAISIGQAIFMALLLLPCAFAVGLLISLEFVATLVAYFILTAAYSFFLKKKLLLDVLTLASLYTMRIIAGAVAIRVMPSFWLLAFSIFLFLSLALVKRYSELLSHQGIAQSNVSGRGYSVGDLPIIGQFGTASGYLSVLVLALYINSDAVTPLYRYPEFLWFVCPPMLYWISLIWLLAARGKMNEDPVLFAITDFRSYVVGISVAICVYLGT